MIKTGKSVNNHRQNVFMPWNEFKPVNSSEMLIRLDLLWVSGECILAICRPKKVKYEHK